MINNTNKLENFALTLPITQAAHAIARQFTAGALPLQKVEQIRLNTLAVCVMNDYLQMMGIPTQITASDIWNPIMRLGADTADLEISGLGRLECRPMKVNTIAEMPLSEQTCYIPPEVWEDRIGYVILQFDELLKEATLLGFVPTAANLQLSLSQLQPLEDLLVYLHQEQQQVATAASGLSQTLVNLNQWLDNIFDTGWETVEALLGSAQTNLAVNFRRSDSGETQPNSVTRAKLIDLGLQLASYSVALVVELIPESAQKTGVLLQVHPTGSEAYLPPQLRLIVIDESGTIFLEAQARRADNYIQLQFSGTPQERFSVKIALNDTSMTENFMI